MTGIGQRGSPSADGDRVLNGEDSHEDQPQRANGSVHRMSPHRCGRGGGTGLRPVRRLGPTNRRVHGLPHKADNTAHLISIRSTGAGTPRSSR